MRAVVRVGHPMRALADVLNTAPGASVARAGNGVSYLAFDSPQALGEWMLATAAKEWTRVVEWSATRCAQRSSCGPTAATISASWSA